MKNKVFRIGFTKKHKLPILFIDNQKDPNWIEIYFEKTQLFDITIRSYMPDARLSTLLLYTHRNVQKQRLTAFRVIVKEYILKDAIIITNQVYIPVEIMFGGTKYEASKNNTYYEHIDNLTPKKTKRLTKLETLQIT